MKAVTAGTSVGHLVGPPVVADSMEGVLAKMTEVEQALPAQDGVRQFNRMYLGVTEAVARRLDQDAFIDPDFMSRLDVVFANYYFAALSARDVPSVPAAWRPLFERRGDRRLHAMQFALAGMNAHINHDLPLAVVSTCQEFGVAPGAHHEDFRRVNALLDATEQSVRRSFEAGWALALDRRVGPIETLLCNWTMNDARAVAWKTASGLWELRHRSRMFRAATESLAQATAEVGRAFLGPL